jgi:hypothetical protein
MRIGVVSDTHNNLRNIGRIVSLFRSAGVARVIHTGDITQPPALRALAEVEVPILGVFGNNDERAALAEAAAQVQAELEEPPFTWELAARRILVVHDPEEFPADPITDIDVLLHGHTHRRTLEATPERLLLNPGECAGHLAGHQTVAVVDLETLTPELLHF